MALGNTSEMNIRVTSTNDAGPGLAEAGAQVEAVDKKAASLGSTFKSVGSEMSAIGGKLTSTVTLPIVGIGAAAVKMGTDFQQQMELVRTQAGASQQEVDSLTNSVLELAKNSAQGPTELATGLYHLESLGLRGAAAMNALTTASQMAAVGNANLEDTTSALGAALVTGIKGTENMSEAAGTLDATIGAGNMRMEDLVNALGSGILPAAKNFGLSLTDVGAALATLTDNGMAADEAATRLRMTFSLMAAPTDKATSALAEIGMTSDEMANKMRNGGLVSAIQDLKTHLEDSGKTAVQQAQIMSDAFGGGRSSAAIMTLVQQVDRLGSKYTQIGDQSGQFADKVAATQETAAYRFHNAWAKVQADLIQLGGALMPAVADAASWLADKVTAISDAFGSLDPTTQKMIITFAGLAAAVGPMLMVFGSLASSVGSIMKLGEALGFLGEAGGAAGAVGSLGGLAALGPVMLALAPLIALVGYNLHQTAVEQKANDDATANATAIIDKFGASQSLTTIFTNAHNTAIANQKTATTNLKTAQDQLAPSNQTLTKAQNDLNTAQSNVNLALQKYGQNSPQYKAATDKLTTAQSNYEQAVHDASDKTLTLMDSQYKLKTANDILRQATQNLNGWLTDQNKDLGDITNTIAQMGPTSDLQVKSIANLGANIANVVTTFKNAQGELQAGIASDIGNFQGLGSTIDKLQSAAGNLQKTASGSTLQVGSSGTGLQGNYGTAPVKLPGHAQGTNRFRGGLTTVGESGPEVVELPSGSKIKPTGRSKDAGSTHTVTIGTIVLSTQAAAKEFFKNLDQDAQSIGKGLTGARGMN